MVQPPSTPMFPGARGPGIDWPELQVHRLECLLLDEPVARPVRTSFGTMHSRPGLLLRVTDDQGTQGVGEAWSNFPPGGARYKATLATRVLAPMLSGVVLRAPHEAFALLDAQLAVLALQCADFGALAQVLSALDQALWDLYARRRGAPLWKLAGARPEVPVYASGIGPQGVGDTILAMARAGHTRFKIKLGFGDAVDADNLREARAALPGGAALMVDVNQGWSFAQAQAWMPRLADMGILWCEEPLRADAPWDHWRMLAEAAGPMRIAGGENLRGMESFEAAARDGAMRVLQPDLGKWGGLSANFALAERLAAGGDCWICPHWLAGGVGLAASLQYKACIGGPGWVEVDANPNPLRSEAFASPLVLEGGALRLPDAPGTTPALAPRFGAGAGWTDTLAG